MATSMFKKKKRNLIKNPKFLDLQTLIAQKINKK